MSDQAAGIGVQPGDLPVGLGVGDQLGQVIAQGGLAAGEDDVRDAQLPQLVEDALPLLGVQLGVSRAGGRCSSGRSRCCSGR